MKHDRETISNERLREVKDLVECESSIHFTSSRAKESIIMLIRTVEILGEEVSQLRDARERFMDQALAQAEESFKARANEAKYALAFTHSDSLECDVHKWTEAAEAVTEMRKEIFKE